MKKQLLLLSLMFLAAISTFAEEVEIGGLWYDVITKVKTATVIQYKNVINYSGDIVIPESVEYNGDTYSVTSIGEDAFSGCSSLTSVTIGIGIKTLGSQAFAKCAELADVYCYAESVPTTQSDAFAESYIEYATLHIPTASIDAYKSTEPWSGFKAFMGLDGTIPETKKCATPTISFANGELEFSCETEDVEFVSEVTVNDAKKNYSSKVSLTGVYKVSVYATRAGYENSDVVTEEFKLGGGGGGIGDVNGDGVIDVADVVAVVNIILKGGD